MPFYRLTSPSYFGGLPATHDATGINNLSGPGTPAPVSVPQPSGTYQNTRFEVPLEIAEATKVNRANSALAENCDFIDDILHTSIPTPSTEAFAAGGGGDTQRALSNDAFVGRSGAVVNQQLRDSLIRVVSNTSLEPIIVSGAAVFVNDIRDSGDAGNIVGLEADGFHVGPIAVFSATIPAATNYRLLYLERNTRALQSNPVEGSGGMGAMAQQLLWTLSGSQVAASTAFTAGLSAWADASNLGGSDIQAAIDEIVNTLGDNSIGVAGALHVGAEAYTGTGTSLTQGSVESQLQELADELAGLAAANVFGGANEFQSDVTITNSPLILDDAGSGNITVTGNSAPFPVDATADGISFDATGNAFQIIATTLDLDAGIIQSLSGVDFNADDNAIVKLQRLKQSGTGTTTAAVLQLVAQPGRDVLGGVNNPGGNLQVFLAAPGTGGAAGNGQRHGGFELRGDSVLDHDGVDMGDCIKRTIVLANEVDDGETITGWYTSPFGALAEGETEVAEITIVGSIRPSAVLSNSGVRAYTCIWARVNPGITVNAVAVNHGVSDAGNTTYLPQTFTATDATQVPTIDITRTGTSGNIEVVAWVKIYRIPAR
jgi:hypothetical protein